MVKTISSWRGGSACAAAARLISSHDQLRIIAFHSHHPVLDDEPVLEEPARCARVDHMFLAQYARGEPIRTLPGCHRNRRLENDGAAVELGAHEVNGTAV